MDGTKNLYETRRPFRRLRILKTLIFILFSTVVYAQTRTIPIEVEGPGLAAEYKQFPLITTTTDHAGKAPAKPLVKIGIIDTGYESGGAQALATLKLCPTGHYDFYSEKPVVARTDKHGTMVGTIIAETLQNVNYCAVIFQVVTKNGEITPETIARAVMRASKEHLQAVNVSLTGTAASFYEARAFKALSDSGARIFVAAGNDHRDLNFACQSYPACYQVKNIQIIGALTEDLEQPAQYSNHGGRVNLWYSGVYNDGFTHAQGTSFAAPRAAADYLLSLTSALPTN